MLEFMSTKKMWTDKSVRFSLDQYINIYFFKSSPVVYATLGFM